MQERDALAYKLTEMRRFRSTVWLNFTLQWFMMRLLTMNDSVNVDFGVGLSVRETVEQLINLY